MRTSSARSSRPINHRSDPGSGYTLTELLVALLVLGLVTALVAPMLFRTSPQRELTRSIELIEQAARMARTEARLTGQDTLLRLDVDARTLLVLPSEQTFALNRDIEIRATVAEAELDGDLASVRFFPEGATTGGTFLLALEDREAAMRINWLTGQAERLDPDELD
ncbi:GspH/FimT family pseudopilin [Hyphobacterium sp.]|uniref:GspH/FimT family pseudopilin n=1 Tax=Hyphobacterium sp. TaxID=2004662 RepID=UPI003BA9599B